MELSFREKSTWISLISTLAIFGYYFYNILGLSGAPEETAKWAAIGLLIQAIVLSSIVEAVFQGMLAVTNLKATKLGADERDKLFEFKGNNWGYWVLVAGVIIVIVQILLQEQLNVNLFSRLEIPLLTAHLLMFTFIASEVARFSGQIFYYRRGA